MSKIWFSSDHHFGHSSILTFVDGDSKHIRPGFKNVNDMNEFMIAQHNARVSPEDKWYSLGDVGFGSSDELDTILSRLNGKKRLILGNHDDGKDPVLQKHFKKILLWRFFKEENFLATHVPVHESALYKVHYSVHGHIHEKPDVSPRHMNISVEKTNYAPISLDTIVSILKYRSSLKENNDTIRNV